MDRKDVIDVKRAINQNAERTTLQDLAKRGIKKVKVLDERGIRKLIEEAVEQALIGSSGGVSDEERDRIIAKSRSELDSLMKDFQGAQSKADLLEQDKTQLASQVESLQEQVKLQKKIAEDERRAGAREAEERMYEKIDTERKKGYEEGAESQARVIKYLEESNAEMKGKLESAISKDEFERLQQTNAEQKTRINELEEKLDGSVSEDVMTSTLETLFSNMEKSIEDRLKKMKVVGGGGGGGAGSQYEDMAPAALVDSLIKQDLESNLGSIGADKKTAGKISDAVSRLRGLRGAGKPEEKSSDE